MQSVRLQDQQDTAMLYRYMDRLEQLHQHKQFHAKQKEVMSAIFEKGYKRIFIRKGRKGGGTECVLYPAARIAGAFPGTSCYIIGPTHKLESEILWKNQRLLRFIPPEWKPETKEAETRLVIPHYGVGQDSFIKIEGADNHKHMVGIEGDVFIFDEFKEHDPRAYENCYPNVAARDGIMIVVGAPPDTRDAFYYQKEMEALNDPNWFVINWSIRDNTFLPGGQAWIESERKSYYDRGDWDLWENLYEARYVFGGKRTVLNRFKREEHSLPHEIITGRIRGDKSKLRWFVSCDPGYATCFAVSFCAFNPYTTEMFVLDEIYETNRTKLNVGYLWPLIQKKKKELYDGGKWTHLYDSAAAGFPNEVRAQFGTANAFRPTVKEKDDEDKYFRIWNSLFDPLDAGKNRCWVSDSCTSGMTEMENYVTDLNGKYPPGGEHWLDTCRYALKAVGYKYTEKQDNLKVVDEKIARSLEQDFRDTRRKDDWASQIEESYLDMEDLN